MRLFRVLILLVVTAFATWILPLGVYYSLAQEAELCGGRRAICLCKRAMQKIQKASVVKIYQSASAQPSISVNDPASSPKFIPSQSNTSLIKTTFVYMHSHPFILSDDGYFHAIDHVPIYS